LRIEDYGLIGDMGTAALLGRNGSVDWLCLPRFDSASEARALFERLTGLTNYLGLLAEEWDVKRQRQVGNFPQAFSHLTLIGAANPIAAAEAAGGQTT
jgi:GH15 family glucan-1,4-alpha-glucosidase